MKGQVAFSRRVKKVIFSFVKITLISPSRSLINEWGPLRPLNSLFIHAQSQSEMSRIFSNEISGSVTVWLEAAEFSYIFLCVPKPSYFQAKFEQHQQKLPFAASSPIKVPIYMCPFLRAYKIARCTSSPNIFTQETPLRRRNHTHTIFVVRSSITRERRKSNKSTRTHQTHVHTRNNHEKRSRETLGAFN